MRPIFSHRFVRQLEKFSPTVQRVFYKQLGLLVGNLRHPSLRAKKYEEGKGTWQARVDQDIRFYFLIEDDTYILLDIKKHPK
ncbi:MAG: hypothetical protein HYT48_02405 [Candidatus Vogelbacteria bacterium]|nr:hypothetical protein [Candidatus Vogelbacteria bacterium]